MKLPAPHYASTPCRGCGEPVLIVSAVSGEGRPVTVALDPTAEVFVRESTGEGGHVWAADNSKQVLAAHRASCSSRGAGRR